jgi:hypothetical protein
MVDAGFLDPEIGLTMIRSSRATGWREWKLGPVGTIT